MIGGFLRGFIDPVTAAKFVFLGGSREYVAAFARAGISPPACPKFLAGGSMPVESGAQLNLVDSACARTGHQPMATITRIPHCCSSLPIRVAEPSGTRPVYATVATCRQPTPTYD